MASYFLYVKTLNYQDKPNYQHLKDLLGSVVKGGLDFSMPQGPAGPSATKNPKSREKVRTQAGVIIALQKVANTLLRQRKTTLNYLTHGLPVAELTDRS